MFTLDVQFSINVGLLLLSSLSLLAIFEIVRDYFFAKCYDCGKWEWQSDIASIALQGASGSEDVSICSECLSKRTETK